MTSDTAVALLTNLNALVGGFFLLCAFGMLVTRQVQGCLRLFIAQSVFLAVSAFLLSIRVHSWHVYAVGMINIIGKPLLLPWLLRRTVRGEVYGRREIDQLVNIPTSLLVAIFLTLAAYFLSMPLLTVSPRAFIGVNLPIGLASLLLGAYTASVRREAVPLLLGLLAMENSAFFAGIAIAPDLPLIAELAITFDVLILVFVAGLLTRAIHEHIGTTEVGALASLKEESKP